MTYELCEWAGYGCGDFFEEASGDVVGASGFVRVDLFEEFVNPTGADK